MKILSALLLTCLFVASAHAKYSGGTGEPNDPYQIATAADLIALGETPADYDKHFILTADIDLDPNLPGRKVFQIGPFRGVFDGNEHTISHLTLPLFYRLEGEVKNLGVVDINITVSADYVGGLATDNWGTVTHCYSTGAVSGRYYVGGLVGINYDGDVKQCYSAGTVSGLSDIGGLVGTNCPVATVTDCYSTGTVSGYSEVGGLVGYNGHGYPDGGGCYAGSVTHCYCTAAVDGNDCVGGLVGLNSGDVTQSYSMALSLASYVSAGWWGEVVLEASSTGVTVSLLAVFGIRKPRARPQVPAAQARPQPRCREQRRSWIPAGTSWARRPTGRRTSGGSTKGRTIRVCGGKKQGNKMEPRMNADGRG